MMETLPRSPRVLEKPSHASQIKQTLKHGWVGVGVKWRNLVKTFISNTGAPGFHPQLWFPANADPGSLGDNGGNSSN